jgi:hypothetical protein
VVGNIDLFVEEVPISRASLSRILSAKYLTKGLSCWVFGYPYCQYIALKL